MRKLNPALTQALLILYGLTHGQGIGGGDGISDGNVLADKLNVSEAKAIRTCQQLETAGAAKVETVKREKTIRRGTTITHKEIKRHYVSLTDEGRERARELSELLAGYDPTLPVDDEAEDQAGAEEAQAENSGAEDNQQASAAA